MLASSSHMEGFCQLRRNLQNLGNCIWWDDIVECRIHIIDRHSIRKTLQNERHGKAGATDSQRPAEEIRICNDPPILFIRRWLPLTDRNS
jgi:hypothetical protein